MKKYNITFGVLYTVLKIDKNKLEVFNGDSERYNALYILARNESIENIYVTSLANYKKISNEILKELDPYNKIKFVYDDIYERSATLNDTKDFSLIKKLSDFLEDKKIDFGVYFISNGYSPNVLPNLIKSSKDENRCVTPFGQALRYGSPSAYCINKLNFPWAMICCDARYIDYELNQLSNLPKVVISMNEETINRKHINSMEDITYKIDNLRYVNGCADKFITYHIKENEIFEKEKIRDFILLATQNTSSKNVQKDYRFNIIKEYFLEDNFYDDLKIYGLWKDPEIVKKYNQFKGLIPNGKINEVLLETKMTFLIPPKKGWYTSKFIDMLKLNVIPFFHKEYDINKFLLKDMDPTFDDVLRIKDPKDLKNKILLFKKHNNERIELLNILKEEFLDYDYENGNFLIRDLNTHLNLELKLNNFI